ncbi:MAG: right-handed parallel beta-helix repeat-containing protein [Thermoplasmata archaeon]|nr:MAG: right-handed parallel beta-helix repeat-containing protein [Thermoplasmata archaeon]
MNVNTYKREKRIKRLKSSSGIICMLIIISIVMLFTPDNNLFQISSGTTIYVPTNYPTIQDAINAAKDGDTVYVYNGTYNEDVGVNKIINLTGEDRDGTIINGGGGQPAVRIFVDWVNISGFTITSGNPVVDGLKVNSDHNTISGNKFTNTRIGISLNYSCENNITANIMLDSGIYIKGGKLENWNSHNIDISNTISGRPIQYWKNQIEGTVPPDAGQVILANCTNVNVESQVISSVCAGIILGFSSNNNLVGNGVFSCNYWYGIGLYYSSENNIIGNIVDNTFYNGFYLYRSHRNNISGNTFSNNGADGMFIDTSHGNHIIGNTISPNWGAIGVRLLYCNGNCIIHNNISSNPKGIYLWFSPNHTIENNTFDWCGHGIYLDSSPLTAIKNNHLHRIGIIGIIIMVSNETIIEGNNISQSGVDGIRIDGSNRCIIAGNTIFSNSDYGIYIIWCNETYVFNNNISSNEESGICIEYLSMRNTICNNNITNNKYGLYLFQFSDSNIITDNILSSNIYDGILLVWSSSNKITGNDISDNLRGINVSSSDGNIISGNNISNSTHGIRLSSAINNAIMGNNITLNNLDGIRLLSSSDWNGIIGNTVILSGNYGFYLNDSTNNSIYHNNIINNTNQAYDGTNNANRWDNGYPSGGNYWSDFDESSEGAYDEYNGEGQDILGSDGIVDNGTIGGGGKNPYMIDSDSRDNYPLIEPNMNFMILKQGWNLISLPLIQEEQNLTKVLKSIDGLYDAVQWYNITDNKDQWKHYKINKPYGNDLFELNEKMGFWVHITQPGDTIFFYNGTRLIDNQNIALHPGWNMVGYPSLNNRDRTAALNNIDFPSDVNAIWTYDSARQRWEKMGPSDGFEIGRGYYVHSKNEVVWEVPL